MLNAIFECLVHSSTKAGRSPDLAATIRTSSVAAARSFMLNSSCGEHISYICCFPSIALKFNGEACWSFVNGLRTSFMLKCPFLRSLAGDWTTQKMLAFGPVLPSLHYDVRMS